MNKDKAKAPEWVYGQGFGWHEWELVRRNIMTVPQLRKQVALMHHRALGEITGSEREELHTLESLYHSI